MAVLAQPLRIRLHRCVIHALIVNFLRTSPALAGREVSPGLLFYEAANVLRYKPDMTQRKVSSTLISIENMGFDVVSPNASTLSEAVKLAYTYNNHWC